MSDDPFDLARFVSAQDDHGTYEQVLRELRAGDKRSHWMWFVFPQIQGLGHSPTARRYAISGLVEAQAYLAHPVLGPRLRESTDLLAAHAGRRAGDMLGGTDALKLRSSMTLFARAAREAGSDAKTFLSVLDSFFAGEEDEATLARI